MDAGNDKKTAPIDGEVVKEPVAVQPVLPQAVMVSPKQLRAQMERDKQIREVINDYIKNNMVEGKDYGSITIGGKQSKPSLFKPGAEKFCGLFKIRPVFKKDPETVEMLGSTPGIIAYICELVDSRGGVIGEGRGSSSVNPDGSDFDVNKAIKIAEKRAQIDAVLRAGGLSDFFTQDMEDKPNTSAGGPTATHSSPAEPRADVPATAKQTDLIGKLAKERFEQSPEFEQFAMDKVGAKADYTLRQASNLISELFKLDKIESDNEEGY